MKAFETSTSPVGKADIIKVEGYEAVGLYLREDRAPKAAVAELRAAGLKLWTVYEKGHPDHLAYFTSQQGKIDGHNAAAYAAYIGQTPESQIYAAADFDPDLAGVNGPVSDYMAAFQKAVKGSDYRASVYSSGLACRILIEKGLAHTGWLSKSTGYREHQKFIPHASIVQGASISFAGLDADLDSIPDANVAGLW
ncbi:MAG TPA: glycoside hydrolase domain-containing protein [Fimbriimonadaceae bacterium]|jgi:hypothetical protein